MLAILLIPAALCYTFGKMVGDTRQGWALLAAMTDRAGGRRARRAMRPKQRGNPRLAALGVDQTASALQPGGNMEGKEVRFGIANSALWATATTAASNGSVNSMHDSFTPLGGLVPLVMMQLGEVVFGGVGSGLYGMLVFVIVAVFVAGLMVGRTPEYLGKKIEAYEMKMASLLILIMPITVLGLTALAVVTGAGKAGPFNPGPHGFSEILYAFTSQGNNNGSAFAGLGANTPFYNIAGGLAMLIGRFWLAVPTLALAGSLARKKKVPAGAGTLPTHTPLFVGWLIAVVLLVGALSFVPALALGPDRRALADDRSMSRSRLDRNRMIIHPEHKTTRRRTAPRAVPAGGRRFLRQARPAPDGAQPGHVRGRGRQRADHGAVGAGAARARARRRPASSARSPSGCGSPCCLPTSPRRWPRGGARRRPKRCAARARRRQAKKLRQPERDGQL